MNVKMFTIYDRVAKLHNSPFCFNTIGQALREFTTLANNPQSTIGQHPEDYTLLEIATFDDNTGLVLPYDKPHLIGSANQYVEVHPTLEQSEQLAQIQNNTG